MIVDKETVKRQTITGILLGFAGICVIFYEHLASFFLSEFRFGILLSLAATFSWAFGTLYTKKQAARFNPYFSLGLQMVISGVVLISVTSLKFFAAARIIEGPPMSIFSMICASSLVAATVS